MIIHSEENQQILYPPGASAPPRSTDVIISKYESITSKNIAAKILEASRVIGAQPKFTKEELAYLVKSADEAGDTGEMKVIIPDPIITLKKGKTEIQVRNAATIVQKMEEKYPTGVSNDKRGLTDVALTRGDVTHLKEDLDELSKTPDKVHDIEGHKVTFQKLADELKTEDELFECSEKEVDEIIEELEEEVSGGIKDNAPTTTQSPMAERFKKIVNFKSGTGKITPEVARCMVAPDEETFANNMKNLPQLPPPDIKTVNKNAYEIRTDVLAMALDLVKWQTEVNLQMARESNQTLTVGADVPKSDIVLDVAKKFYAFVENRR